MDSPHADAAKLLETMSDELIYGAVNAFVRGLLHRAADKLAAPIVETVVEHLAELGETLATPAEPPPEPAPEPPAPTPLRPVPDHVDEVIAKMPRQDTVERTCVVCFRVGTRRFTPGKTGWRCTETATCARRAGIELQPAPQQQPQAQAAPPAPPKVIPLQQNPPAPPRGEAVTARCTDCTRCWTLTGRVLEQAVDMHERRHDGHVVEVLT